MGLSAEDTVIEAMASREVGGLGTASGQGFGFGEPRKFPVVK